MSDKKVKIGGRAWIPKSVFPNRDLRRIQNDNVVKLRPGPYEDEATAVKVYGETPTHIGLPRAFYERTASGAMDVEYNVSERSLDVECQIDPRDELQQSCVRQVTNRLQQRRATQTLFKSGTGTGKCLREDALVSTDDGLKRIGDIVPNLDDECLAVSGLEVDTFRGKHSVDSLYAKRKEKCLKATTSSGYEVSGTYNHPVLVFREEGYFEWVELQNLSVGDTIALRHFDIEGEPSEWPDIDGFNPSTDKITEDFAWLIGLLIGDGCFVRKGNVSLTSQSDPIVSKARRVLEDLGFKLNRVGDEGSGDFNITNTNSVFRSLLRKLGVEFERSEAKSVPDFIFESGEGVIRSFISGYWDADGYFAKPNRREAAATSSSRKLLREIQILLLGFGVKSDLSVKNGRYNGERVQHHRLTIRGVPLKKAVDNVFTDITVEQKCDRANEIRGIIEGKVGNPNKYNPPASQLFDRLNERISTRESRRMYRGQTEDGKKPSKRVLRRFRRHVTQQIDLFGLSNEDLNVLSELCREDLFFDTVTSVEDDGEHRVCDLEIIGERNFVANGVVCHNTCMALMVAAELGLAPLILVHKSSIKSGWLKQIKKDPGVFPDAKVGEFQGSTREFGDDYDIVVGMIQTLANCDKDHPIFNWPGILLVDEVHRVSAPTFSKVVPRFNAAKKLGFSATIRRKDGGEPIFHKELGYVCWEGGQTSMQPIIFPVRTDFYVKDDYPMWLERKIMIEDESRNEQIVDEIIKAIEAGRNPMVMTSNLSHIALLKTRFEDRYDGDISIGKCCGQYYVDEQDAIDYVKNWSQYQNRFDEDELIEWYLSDGKDNPPENFDPDIHKINFEWTRKEEVQGKSREKETVRVRILKENFERIEPIDGFDDDQDVGEFQRQFDTSKVIRWIKLGKSYSAPDPFDPEKHKAVFAKPIEEVLKEAFDEVKPRTDSIDTEQFENEEKKSDLLFATFGKIKEGFDEPRLDAGILAIPKSDPEQLVGRFTREMDGKEDPVFTHFVDDRMGKFQYTWDNAQEVYREMGAKILPLPEE